MHLKILAGKWRPFCLGLNMLNYSIWIMMTIVSAQLFKFVVFKHIYSEGDCAVIIRKQGGKTDSQTAKHQRRQTGDGSRRVFLENTTQWLVVPWVNIEYISKTGEKPNWGWVTMHKNYHFCDMIRNRSWLLWSTNLFATDFSKSWSTCKGCAHATSGCIFALLKCCLS